ncbi:MAG: flippase, partial [ANME-2 cluster archaeon]
MNTVRRIAKNTIVLLIAQIVTMALGFFYVMYTARYLGAEGFGVLSFGLAFTGIFSVFTDLGLSQLTVREVARNKTLASKYIGNIMTMKLFLVSITLVLIIFFINVLGYPKNTIYVVYFLSASIILNGFIQSFKSIYQAYEKMEYVSLFNILNTIFLLAGVLIAINQQFNVIAFAAIYFVTSFIILTLNIFVLQIKFTKFSFLIEMDFWKTTLKEAFPFGLSGIFVVIYFYIDSVMLSLMKSDEVVGWYNASYKLVFILLF